MSEPQKSNSFFNVIGIAFIFISGPLALLFWAAGTSTETIFLVWIGGGILATVGLLSSK